MKKQKILPRSPNSSHLAKVLSSILTLAACEGPAPVPASTPEARSRVEMALGETAKGLLESEALKGGSISKYSKSEVPKFLKKVPLERVEKVVIGGNLEIGTLRHIRQTHEYPLKDLELLVPNYDRETFYNSQMMVLRELIESDARHVLIEGVPSSVNSKQKLLNFLFGEDEAAAQNAINIASSALRPSEKTDSMHQQACRLIIDLYGAGITFVLASDSDRVTPYGIVSNKDLRDYTLNQMGHFFSEYRPAKESNDMEALARLDLDWPRMRRLMNEQGQRSETEGIEMANNLFKENPGIVLDLVLGGNHDLANEVVGLDLDLRLVEVSFENLNEPKEERETDILESPLNP